MPSTSRCIRTAPRAARPWTTCARRAFPSSPPGAPSRALPRGRTSTWASPPRASCRKDRGRRASRSAPWPGLSRLLADDVEQGLTLLLADHAEAALERRRQLGGILDPLAVSARGAADHLVIGRGLQAGERHGVRLDGP